GRHRHRGRRDALGGPMSAFDVETLADKALDMLGVAPGQVIWIWASNHSLDLIEALAVRIRARGAFWTVRLVIESLLPRVGRESAVCCCPLSPGRCPSPRWGGSPRPRCAGWPTSRP